MGISFSNNRRRNQTYPPPPPPPPHPHPHPHPYYYPPEPPLYPAQPQTPYPPPPPVYNNSYGSAPHSTSSYSNPAIGRFHYHYTPYHPNQTNGWPAIRGPVGPPLQPAPYVEHQNAKKVRNDVNVHKHTLKLEVDEHNPDHQLVSFVFDALVDGSITIYYFAKEESDCKFVPVFPEAHTPKRISFQKGLGQKFRQPSGTGIDLGFFELDDLSKPSPEEDVFPLVIVAETSAQHSSSDEHLRDPAPSTSANLQITQTVVEKSEGNSFNVKVIRQILWVDGVRYELREIYGLGSTDAAASFDDGDSGKECVICMSEPKDTAVLPCRHMCLCSDCAKELRLQTNKCPICRQPIEELIEIKISSGQ